MDLVGLWAAVAVLVVGVLVGVWRRRTDGQLRDVGSRRDVVRPGRGESAHDPGGEHLRAQATGGGSGSVGKSTPATGRVASGGAGEGSADSTEVRAGLVVAPDVREEPGVIEGTGEDSSAAGQQLDAALLRELGVGEGKATLLQFSSAFCAPCRAVRRVSSEVAGIVPGVQHVEVDAESHLDAVRALGIWRTPTLLVLDSEGRVAKRATGVPGKPQLIAALGDVL